MVMKQPTHTARLGGAVAAIRIASAITATLFAVITHPAHAGGDAIAGEKVAEPCQQCHNPAAPNPAFPQLAGQYEDYLLRTLVDYQIGNRSNPIMKGLAGPLSEQEMEDVAAYYAGLTGNLFTITYAK